MGSTFSIRLPEDLAKWLDSTARETGVPRGRLIRNELERARSAAQRPFMRWAGVVQGPKDLSTRKGFAGQTLHNNRAGKAQ